MPSAPVQNFLHPPGGVNFIQPARIHTHTHALVLAPEAITHTPIFFLLFLRKNRAFPLPSFGYGMNGIGSVNYFGL